MAILTAVTLSGCDDGETANEYCQSNAGTAICENGGTLQSNDDVQNLYRTYYNDACCACVDGYMGERCAGFMANKFFLGDWSTENVDMVTGTLPSKIYFVNLPGSQESRLRLILRGILVDTNRNIDIKCDLSTTSAINIPSTVVPWKDSHFPVLNFSDNGTLVNGKAWTATGVIGYDYASAIQFYTNQSIPNNNQFPLPCSLQSLTVTLDGVVVIQTETVAENNYNFSRI